MRRLVQAGIVIALLLTCAGLLLPSVSRVKGAAEQMRCHQKCKHIALSWHSYLDTFEHTVAGTFPNPDFPPEQRLSWAVTIHPDDSQPDILRLLDTRAAWDAPANAPYTAVQKWAFVCSTTLDAATRNQTTYLGVAGVGADAATLPADDPRAGAFGYDRTLKAKDFTDGTANTMLLLETRSGGPWAQGGPGTVRGLDPSNPPYTGSGRPFDGDHRNYDWWEKPKRSVMMTTCDGSVRMLRDSVAPDVLEAFATIRGGDKIRVEEIYP